MCGILLIDGVSAIAPDRVESALRYLGRRGPNLTRSWQQGDLAVWHSVLHITGSAAYYHQTSDEDFCAFAGEIYNYRELGYDSDAWCVHDTVKNRTGRLKQLIGPSSWIYATGNFVCYATDPQGERHLYRYQDQNCTIVASEVGIIARLIDLETKPSRYANKGWTLLSDTPYHKVTRMESGRLYINHEPAHMIDSVFAWVKPEKFRNMAMAAEEFRVIWNRVMNSMTPNEPATVSYSGGVDSGLIAHALPAADLLALDMAGKDPNIAVLSTQLSQSQQMHLCVQSVTLQQYAGAYQDMLSHTRMPCQSWSHVGKWMVAKHAGNRIIFSGAGADELFGGYPVYLGMPYTDTGSVSPYSQHHDWSLWKQCLDCYDQDPGPATLLLDYLYQVVGCDSQGLDRAAGAWARETRAPFMHPDIVKFALSLPWNLRVGNESKPVLKTLWRQAFPDHTLWPKQGFAGHANDSAPWLGIEIDPTGNRLTDWQSIAVNSFYQTVANLSV